MDTKHPIIERINTVMDCAPGQADTLASFYSHLLGWPITHSGGGWAAITAPGGTVHAYQETAAYTPPVWPWKEGAQGQMLHMDFYVDDLQAALQHALACGATLADTQYFATSRTLFDPAGHPFCLDTDEPEP